MPLFPQILRPLLRRRRRRDKRRRQGELSKVERVSSHEPISLHRMWEIIHLDNLEKRDEDVSFHSEKEYIWEPR